MKKALAIAFLLALSAGAQQTLKKEGGVWVTRDSGSVASKNVLKVIAAARIQVKPSKSDSIQYVLTRRFPEVGDGEAKRLMSMQAIVLKEGPEYCVLTAADMPGRVLSELQIEVPGNIRNLSIQSRNGNLSIADITAEIQAVTSAGSVEMDRIQGNVVARTGGGAMTFGRVEGSLRCLSGGGNIRAGRIAAEAVLETAGGEIFVDEVGGVLRLSTAGNIHVGRALRSVSAHSSGGLIEVESAGGLVTAETGGGGISIGTAPGVRCESASGTIRLNRVSGSVRASTAAGNIYAGFDETRQLENSFLATTRGDITAILPSNLAVTVKALNESGGWLARFASEFSEIQARFAETGSSRPILVEGSLNGGGPLLMMSVSNGGIYLKKRK